MGFGWYHVLESQPSRTGDVDPVLGSDCINGKRNIHVSGNYELLIVESLLQWLRFSPPMTSDGRPFKCALRYCQHLIGWYYPWSQQSSAHGKLESTARNEVEFPK